MDVVISQSRERLLAADGTIDFASIGAPLNKALRQTIVNRRWFGGKAKSIRDLATVELIGRELVPALA